MQEVETKIESFRVYLRNKLNELPSPLEEQKRLIRLVLVIVTLHRFSKLIALLPKFSVFTSRITDNRTYLNCDGAKIIKEHQICWLVWPEDLLCCAVLSCAVPCRVERCGAVRCSALLCSVLLCSEMLLLLELKVVMILVIVLNVAQSGVVLCSALLCSEKLLLLELKVVMVLVIVLNVAQCGVVLCSALLCSAVKSCCYLN